MVVGPTAGITIALISMLPNFDRQEQLNSKTLLTALELNVPGDPETVLTFLRDGSRLHLVK